jgi:hypothetical protein
MVVVLAKEYVLPTLSEAQENRLTKLIMKSV